MEENTLEQKSSKFIIAVSILIPLVVAILFGIKLKDFGYDIEPLSFLPPIYATINGLTGIVLVLAVLAIKNGKRKAKLENSGGIEDKIVINISSGHIEVGNDPIDFSLQLRNPVSSVDFSGNAKGRFTLDHIKQFTKLEPGTSISGMLNADLGFAGNKTAIDQKQYDKILLNGTAGLSNVNYKSSEYPTGINIAGTQLQFNQKNVTLSNLSGKYLGTNFTATGVLNNLIGYAMQEQPLNGSMNVNADELLDLACRTDAPSPLEWSAR